MHRWVDFIVERLVANKESGFTAEVKKHMNMLITQLITFSKPHPLFVFLDTPVVCVAFSRDHSIRLEVVSLLKVIIQSQLISDDVISKQ